MTALQFAGIAMIAAFALAWLALAAKSAPAKAALQGVLWGLGVSAYLGLAAWLIAGGAA